MRSKKPALGQFFFCGELGGGKRAAGYEPAKVKVKLPKLPSLDQLEQQLKKQLEEGQRMRGGHEPLKLPSLTPQDPALLPRQKQTQSLPTLTPPPGPSPKRAKPNLARLEEMSKPTRDRSRAAKEQVEKAAERSRAKERDSPKQRRKNDEVSKDAPKRMAKHPLTKSAGDLPAKPRRASPGRGKPAQQAEAMNKAAVKVQARQRGILARSATAQLRQDKAKAPAEEAASPEAEEVRQQAASKIQAQHRGNTARQSVSRLRAEPKPGNAKVRQQAASKIQAQHRGNIARQSVSRLRAEPTPGVAKEDDPAENEAPEKQAETPRSSSSVTPSSSRSRSSSSSRGPANPSGSVTDRSSVQRPEMNETVHSRLSSASEHSKQTAEEVVSDLLNESLRSHTSGKALPPLNLLQGTELQKAVKKDSTDVSTVKGQDVDQSDEEDYEDDAYDSESFEEEGSLTASADAVSFVTPSQVDESVPPSLPVSARDSSAVSSMPQSAR